MPWKVYVLSSRSAGRTYVGVTSDLGARVRQHNGVEPGGARSTRQAAVATAQDLRAVRDTRRGAERSVEHAVKKLRGAARLRWKPPSEE